MIPQKEDIGRHIKDKSLPSKEVPKSGRANPFVEIYYWWKPKPDKPLILLCSSLFAVIFILGQYFLNPMLKADLEILNRWPFISLFSLDIFLIVFVVQILLLSIVGAVPLIPFSFAFGVLHKEKEANKTFLTIIYTVAFLFFPSIILYNWIRISISHGFPIFNIVLGSLFVLIDSLFLSIILIFIMSYYNRFFYSSGVKIRKSIH